MPQLNIDCEGPITQNDNAYELCQNFIPDGGRFFSIVSKYDDFLADVEKRPGYKAGDTLKLILPFLKAFGVTDRLMEEFSGETLLLLPGAEHMLPAVNSMLPSFIISTSYRPYLHALCTLVSFPMGNVYCTEVSLDEYRMPDAEQVYLKECAMEIAGMDMIDWPEDASSADDLSPECQGVVKRLDEIFWEEITSMEIGRIFEAVNPVGGVEKAKAVEASLSVTGLSAGQVLYVGDSITDVQAMEFVDSAGGTAVSFNGNRYAVKAAKWALLSSDTLVIAGLCRLLLDRGTVVLDNMDVDSEGRLNTDVLLQEMHASSDLSGIPGRLSGNAGFEMYKVSASDMGRLIEKSEQMRKSVRGHRIGELG
jgi:predicted HAD superfamily phosphohydrolase